MDFLNRASAQLRDLFLSMTPGARITAGLLLAVVVVSTAYLFQFQISGPDAYLMGGQAFSNDELAIMEGALGKAGLSNFERDGNRIRIPRGQEAVYMAALVDADALPQCFGEYIDKALTGQEMFEDRRTKEERLKAAKQKELSLWIRTMPGIEKASVLYDQKKVGGLNPIDVTTASVSVKPAAGARLEPQRIRGIQKLVAAAFAGLHPEDVTVADLNGSILPGGPHGEVFPENYHLNLKQRYEESIEESILDQLAYIPGVRAQVRAELDKEIDRETKEVVVDKKNVTPLISQSLTKKNSSQARPPAGAPGIASQGGPSSGPVTISGGRESTSEETTREEETQNVVPAQHTVAHMKGQTLKSARASIVVPASYYRMVWLDRNKPADGSEPPEPTADDLQKIEVAEKKNIASAVAPLLATEAADGDLQSQVTVTTFHALSSDPIAAPTLTEEAFAWVGDQWGTLTTAGLAFFSLLMLRSMIKSVPSPDPAVTDRGHNLELVTDAETTIDSTEEGSPGAGKRRFAKGPSYKDDLATMVREDPDAAATILQAWIASAG